MLVNHNTDTYTDRCSVVDLSDLRCIDRKSTLVIYDYVGVTVLEKDAET